MLTWHYMLTCHLSCGTTRWHGTCHVATMLTCICHVTYWLMWDTLHVSKTRAIHIVVLAYMSCTRGWHVPPALGRHVSLTRSWHIMHVKVWYMPSVSDQHVSSFGARHMASRLDDIWPCDCATRGLATVAMSPCLCVPLVITSLHYMAPIILQHMATLN